MPGRVRNKIIFIFCEGKENKTERSYFESLRQEKRLSNYKIKVKHKTGQADPEGLVKYAKSLVITKEIDFKLGDLAWCVFDADNNTQKQLDKAKKAAGKNIQLFLSNPSFELWYLLHFELYKDSINNPDLVKKLENYIPNYEKNKCYYHKVLNRQVDAINNAKALESMHTDNNIDLFSRKSNPSTQIYEIIEKIEKLI